jgi:phenylacetyl-CoA:acceptor oxidoreductase 26-kDa subunit
MRRDVIGRVAPWIQMNWDWRAAGNFIAGGTGSGLLVWAMATGVASSRVLIVLGLACVGAGLLCVWAEIGRPWRALNVFRHARTSWMTREALVALGIFACGAAVFARADSLQRSLLGACALAFLYCQARMLQAAKGIPAWRHPRVVPLVAVTGLTEGAGLLLLYLTLLAPRPAPDWFVALLALLLLGRVVYWQVYRRGVRVAGAPRAALDALHRLDRPLVAADLLGCVLAAASLLLTVGPWLRVVAAALALVGGWVLKWTIIRRAAFNQGFALVLAPERGVGGSGPPARPGWEPN